MRTITAPRVLFAAMCAVLAGAAGSLAGAGEMAGGNSELRLAVRPLGRYVSTATNPISAAEIVQYDPSTQRLFIVNAADASVDVVSIADPALPVKVGGLTNLGGTANSVAVSQGLLAVAIEATPKTNPGKVAFFDAQSLEQLAIFPVGALPDMVTFTPDGSAVLVANEAEPNAGYTIDPVGSVSVIDLRWVENPLEAGNLQAAAIVRTAGFEHSTRRSPSCARPACASTGRAPTPPRIWSRNTSPSRRRARTLGYRCRKPTPSAFSISPISERRISARSFRLASRITVSPATSWTRATAIAPSRSRTGPSRVCISLTRSRAMRSRARPISCLRTKGTTETTS